MLNYPRMTVMGSTHQFGHVVEKVGSEPTAEGSDFALRAHAA